MTDKPQKLKVFLCHASENKPIVQGLYDRLSAAGFDPWLDSHFLLPGMDWDLEIQKAMRSSDAVIVCLSKISVVKEGYVQKEIKYAQEIQKEKPEGTIFLIPLQLEKCEIPFSLQDVQWGEYFESDGFELLVKALNKRADQLKRTLGTTTDSTYYKGPPSGSYLPFLRNHLFTGREEDLKKLSVLCEPGDSNIIIPRAIIGMGGIGKTQLAVEFAYRYGHHFKGVHWLNLRDPEELEEVIAICGAHMGIDIESKSSLSAASAATEHLWKVDGPRLLILDNFEDVTKTGTVLSRFQHPALRLLITSRRKDFPKSVDLQIQELGIFNEEESLEFLSRTLKRKESKSAKKQLVEKLGYLPLAIEMAISYINVNGVKISEYLHDIEDILSHESMQAEWFKALDITNPTEHDQSLLATFRLSWQEVKDETTRKIFGNLCRLRPIKRTSIRKYLTMFEVDEKTISRCIYRLQMLNLLISSDDVIFVHPLLASFGRLVIEDVFHDKKETISSGLGTPLLTGTISAPVVTEVGGITPNNIIRADQDWQIKVDWSLQGSLLSGPFFLFRGEWIVRVYLESMGPSYEYEIPIDGSGAHVSVATFTPDGPSKRNYTTTIHVAPKAVDPGIYKMVTAVTYESSPGVPGPIAGFHEGGMLQLL